MVMEGVSMKNLIKIIIFAGLWGGFLHSAEKPRSKTYIFLENSFKAAGDGINATLLAGTTYVINHLINNATNVAEAAVKRNAWKGIQTTDSFVLFFNKYGNILQKTTVIIGGALTLWSMCGALQKLKNAVFCIDGEQKQVSKKEE